MIYYSIYLPLCLISLIILNYLRKFVTTNKKKLHTMSIIIFVLTIFVFGLYFYERQHNSEIYLKILNFVYIIWVGMSLYYAITINNSIMFKK